MVSPPNWLSTFVNAVTATMKSHDVLSPLGCHFHQVDDEWEITVFASRTEIVGGPQDGLMCNACFSVDVIALIKLFSTVDSVSWQAQPLGHEDELGSHLAIEGSYEDYRIWLRITAAAPARYEPGRRALVNQRRMDEIW